MSSSNRILSISIFPETLLLTDLSNNITAPIQPGSAVSPGALFYVRFDRKPRQDLKYFYYYAIIIISYLKFRVTFFCAVRTSGGILIRAVTRSFIIRTEAEGGHA